MDLLTKEEGASGDLVVLKVKSEKEGADDKPFLFQFNSQVYEVPAGSLFRVPRSHFTHVHQSPGATNKLEIVDTSKGSVEYFEAERKRRQAAIDAKKQEIEQQQRELAELEAQGGKPVATAGPPKRPTKE